MRVKMKLFILCILLVNLVFQQTSAILSKSVPVMNPQYSFSIKASHGTAVMMF